MESLFGDSHINPTSRNCHFFKRKLLESWLSKKQTEHSNPIFSKLELLKIEDICQLQLLSFAFDCQNKIAPVYFHDYFVQCSQFHNFNTRLASHGDLFLERKNTFQYGIRSIEYNGASLWNMLPVNLRVRTCFN